MSFSNFFRSGLELVVSHRNVHVYMRKLNQNPTFYLMSGGLVLHVGKRKHVMRKFREYRPDYFAAQALTMKA